MSKLSVTEALKIVSVSKTTLYSDMDKGVVSYDLDVKGRKRVDIAELQRVYGPLNTPETENANPHNGTPDLTHQETSQPTENNNSEVVKLLESQIEHLQTEVSTARERETKLLEMLALEQQKTQQLMLPPPRKRKRTFRDIFRLT